MMRRSILLTILVGTAVIVTAQAQRSARRDQSPALPPAMPVVAPQTTARLDLSALPTYPHAGTIQVVDASGVQKTLQLCENWGAGPYGEQAYSVADATLPWQAFSSQGEYIGPARIQHVPEYRLRVDDRLEFVYRLTRIESGSPYELNVGDSIRVESLIDSNLDRDLVIQPDGTITLRMLGQVRAARRTVEELRQDLEERYKKYYKVPSITVTPLTMNTILEDLRATVDSRAGAGGQFQEARVTPEGSIQLPAIGSIHVQGLTLDELKREIDERYAAVVVGMEVTPRLIDRAPRFVYVVGEVFQPGRFAMEAPTTVMQSIALAGGWRNGGDLRNVIIFRRTADWRLIATRLNVRPQLFGNTLDPCGEIWLRDSDIIVVPKNNLLVADDVIELIFTRGIYGVIPFQGVSLNFAKASTL